MQPRSFNVPSVLVLVVGLLISVPAFADSGSGSGEFKFSGVIESLPASGLMGDWTVAGRTVHVTSSTRIEQEDGPIAVGATVKVEGRLRSDDSVDAREIEVKQRARGEGEVKFKGTIESFPNTAGFVGDWQIGGRTVRVTSNTRIEQEDGPVAVGAFVEVEGATESDGVFEASKIEVKSNVQGGDGRDELKGTIESLPDTAGFIGDWTVSGRTVHVSSTTTINQEHGAVEVGAMVEVKGQIRGDGSLDATRIEVKPVSDDSGKGGGKANFKGTIESLPDGLIGEWTISGTTVIVTDSTRIQQQHGQAGVGVRVKVKGTRQSDGSVLATKIQVKDPN